MNHHHRTDDAPPRPELLAGFLDGELDDSARRALEAWLIARPEAAVELAAHARLERLFAASAPEEPAEMAWRIVLDGIEAGVAIAPAAASVSGSVVVAPSRTRSPVRVAALLACAAALLVALYTGFPDRDSDDHELLVADATEVDITSLETAGAADAAIVVGEPPVRGPLELATTEDIRLHRFDPLVRERAAIVRMDDDDDAREVPIVVVQLR